MPNTSINYAASTTSVAWRTSIGCTGIGMPTHKNAIGTHRLERASVKGETLGVWDFVHADEGDERAAMSFPQGATLLTLTMR